MTAPTEEEIRAAIARHWAHDSGKGHRSVDWEWSEAWCGALLLLDDLYDLDDMRESELDALGEAVTPVVNAVRDEAHRALIEALVRVGIEYAADHPDVPRKPQLTTA